MPVTLSLVGVSLSGEAARLPRPRAARPRRAPSRRAARRGRRPGRRPRRIRRAQRCRDRDVRMVVSTTMPRLTVEAGRLREPALGRMPTAITTRSPGIAVPSSSSQRPRRVRAEDRLRVGLRDHVDAALLDGPLQQIARGGVELALHQGRHQMHDRHVHALHLEARGGLEAEQPAADDDGLGRAICAASSMAFTSSRSR